MLPDLTPQIPYQALIFDCDGTIADTLPLHFQAWTAALSPYNLPFTEEWYYQRAGLSSMEMFSHIRDVFEINLDIAAVNATRKQIYRSLLPTVKEVPFVAAVVRQHHGRVPMAIASGGERSNIEATLAILQMRHFFGVLVSFNDVQRGKPEPDLFLLAVEKLGVSPVQCVIYEDSDSGLEAARRAGISAIDIRPFLQRL